MHQTFARKSVANIPFGFSQSPLAWSSTARTGDEKTSREHLPPGSHILIQRQILIRPHDVGAPSFPLPETAMDEQRQHANCRRLPRRSLGSLGRLSLLATSYLTASKQFSLGFFCFIDVSTFSKSDRNGSDVHINFVDWIPGMCSALGMLVINSIDKSRLNADTFSYSGNGVAWKARAVLFLGFALMAGGLAGSVV